MRQAHVFKPKLCPLDLNNVPTQLQNRIAHISPVKMNKRANLVVGIWCLPQTPYHPTGGFIGISINILGPLGPRASRANGLIFTGRRPGPPQKPIKSTKLLSTLGPTFLWKSKSSIKHTFQAPFSILTQEIWSIFRVDSEFDSLEAVGPLFWWVFRKFTCGLGFAGRRRRRTTTDKRDGRDGRTDRGRWRRTTATDGRDGGQTEDDDDGGHDGRRTTDDDKKIQWSYHMILMSYHIISYHIIISSSYHHHIIIIISSLCSKNVTKEMFMKKVNQKMNFRIF